MPDNDLEHPEAVEHLYLAASSEEVLTARPFMTGDVFEGVAIPGLDGIGLAIVLTHPCAMRADGMNLAQRLLMARVVPSDPIPLERWNTGHYKVMPLPGLCGRHHSARFDEIGLVSSSLLGSESRSACMTPYGVHFLQQRFIWHLTRFLAPTHRLAEATEAVFAEADLQEEWVEAALSRGEDAAEAATAFHSWVRSPDESGTARQTQLEKRDRRSGLRRQMRRHLRDSGAI